jgi:hypothetical protein
MITTMMMRRRKKIMHGEMIGVTLIRQRKILIILITTK